VCCVNEKDAHGKREVVRWAGTSKVRGEVVNGDNSPEKGDGGGVVASFFSPSRLSVVGDGNVLVVDFDCIRSVNRTSEFAKFLHLAQNLCSVFGVKARDGDHGTTVGTLAAAIKAARGSFGTTKPGRGVRVRVCVCSSPPEPAHGGIAPLPRALVVIGVLVSVV
jgi:hypothetical protein